MKDVLIPNHEQLWKKIEQIKKDGVSHLHVVSDFDRTLTPAFIDGKKPTSSFANIREEGGYLPDEYYGKAKVLFNKYYAIEISDDISLPVKKKKMSEWWEKHLNLFVKYGLTKKDIGSIVHKRNISLRHGADELLRILSDFKVPVLIFSAGLGDIIKEILLIKKSMHSNIHIISNLFKFNSEGKVTGYHGSVVHVFNKDEGQVKNSPYYGQMKNRKNVILLGDSLGDSNMLNGLSHNTTLKIAFLNKDNEKFKKQYEKEFDVLILNDGPMDFVNGLLRQII